MARDHNGKWEKGTSGNPGGRPKAPVRFRELYDNKGGDDAIFGWLWELAESDPDGRVRVAAMDRLLERRYGKAPTCDDNGEAVGDTTISVVIPSLGDIEYNPEPH